MRLRSFLRRQFVCLCVKYKNCIGCCIPLIIIIIFFHRRFRDGHDDRDGSDRSEREAWGRDRGNRDDKAEQPWVRMGEGASNSPTSERPRLNLKPRTAPVNNEEKKSDKPNPFGKAKPVDVRESPEGGERKPAPKVGPNYEVFLESL